MSVVDHLRELRDRIIWSLMAIAIAATVVFIFFTPIVHLMTHPYKVATISKEFPDGRKLIFTGPLDAFIVRLKVAAYGGVVVSSPFVFFHPSRLISPRPHPHEKRYATPLR